MRKKSFIISIIFLVFIFLETLTNQFINKNPQQDKSQYTNPDVKGESSNKDIFVKVKKIIDGDTIQIEGGEKVRYIGIDTPETVDPRKSVGCFGKEASNKNKELVEGKIVKLVKDVSENDKYKRLLRYVWVGDIFVNDYLVRQGYATAVTFPPDIRYQKQFRNAQQEAKTKNLGLWSLCP